MRSENGLYAPVCAREYISKGRKRRSAERHDHTRDRACAVKRDVSLKGNHPCGEAKKKELEKERKSEDEKKER